MRKYAWISVPVEVKKRLEKVKGKKDWGEFLLELIPERKKLESKRAFEELAQTITPHDLKAMTESSEEFRENFAFR